MEAGHVLTPPENNKLRVSWYLEVESYNMFHPSTVQKQKKTHPQILQMSLHLFFWPPLGLKLLRHFVICPIKKGGFNQPNQTLGFLCHRFGTSKWPLSGCDSQLFPAWGARRNVWGKKTPRYILNNGFSRNSLKNTHTPEDWHVKWKGTSSIGNTSSNHWFSGWLNQSIWKNMLVKLDYFFIFSRIRMNIKTIFELPPTSGKLT